MERRRVLHARMNFLKEEKLLPTIRKGFEIFDIHNEKRKLREGET